MNKVILLLLLLKSIDLKAQRPLVKEEIIHQQIAVKHALNGGNTNAIITTLAEGNGKQTRNVQYVLSLDQKINTGADGNMQRSTITSGEITVSGDVFYKGFNISDRLVPSRVEFVLKSWMGNTLHKSVTFNNVNVTSRKPEKKETAMEDSLGRITHRTIENFLPVYTSNDIQQFNDRVKLVKNYFTDAVKLTESISLLNSINWNDLDRFNLQQQKFNDVKNRITEIENKNYSSHLSLSGFDPAKMLNNLSLFHSQVAIIQRDYDHALSTLHLAYYNRGMDLLRYGNVNNATHFFQQSLAVHPGFAPALLQMALIDFRQNHFTEAVAKADDILYRLNPDPDTRRLTYQLLNDIYESHLDKAAGKLNAKDYDRALEHYTMAKSICDKYTNVRCSDELFKGIRSARNGIYNVYLESAQEQLNKKNFDKATQAVNEAIAYQRNNSNDITDDSAARKLLKEITRQQYYAKIEDGKQALTNRQYETALNAFEAATQMETDYGLSASAELPGLKTTAAKPLIALKLNEGDSLVLVNKLPEARTIVRTIADMQARYQLKSEKAFNTRLEELRKKIFSQQCENAQRAFDDAYLHGKDAASLPDYIKADDFFLEAEKINEENKDCEVNTRDIAALHNALLPAATYLKKMRQVNLLQQEGNYREAQALYEEASSYFSANNVTRFSITHEAFYDYLLTKANNGFAYYAADYYAANDPDKSLALYRLLINRNYDSKQLKGSLYKLGLQYGKKEKLDHPGEKYSRDFAREHTQGDKNMKPFEKGYKKGWKMKY